MGLDLNCPGSRLIKSPVPEYVVCPNCGEEVEIWSDEVRATCPKCKAVVARERLPSCAEWCRSAEACLGSEAYAHLQRKADGPPDS